jgi:hypothetical protein
MNLSFHQTFAPERDCLGRLLALASEMSPMTKEEISLATGIPTGSSSGKVDPHIRYAEYMGLICDDRSDGMHRLTRTPLGEEIFRSDPFLSEPLSLLLCHVSICRRDGGADLWHYLFCKAARYYGLVITTKQLNLAASREFGVRGVNLTPLRTCYTKEKSLAALSLLSVDDSDNWRLHPHRYRSEFRYAYAYHLLSLWDQQSPESSEVPFDEVIESWQWAAPYLWDEATALNTLDQLCDLGVVSLNRQLSPITVVRVREKSAVLAHLYKLLI